MRGVIKVCLAVAFVATLIAGGYVWRQADRVGTDRAEWLNVPIRGDDDTIGVAFSADGFLNRDVRVSVFTFGEADCAAR